MKLKLLVFVVMIGVAAASTFSLYAQESKSQWDGVYTVEQAARGETLYVARCQACHADDLSGFAMEYSDPEPPALVGRTFASGWDTFTLGELFETINYTMPADDPGTLSPQESADILAFILLKAEYPAGEAELSMDAEELRTYTFLAEKPGTND